MPAPQSNSNAILSMRKRQSQSSASSQVRLQLSHRPLPVLISELLAPKVRSTLLETAEGHNYNTSQNENLRRSRIGTYSSRRCSSR